MSNKLRQFQSLLNEGISHEDLSDVLHNRLQFRYPDVIDKYGYDAVENAVSDVASFHAGAEELGSSDISIMLKEIIKQLESSNVDEAIQHSPERLKQIAQGWAAKHPNIDDEIAAAEKAYDPYYQYASGPTYSRGKQAAEHLRYLKSVKNIIDSGLGSEGVAEGYNTRENNRQYFDNFEEWVQEVRHAGGDVYKGRDNNHIRAMGHDGDFGEFDRATGEGWMVDRFMEGVAEGLSDTQKKIEDTILKLEQRLKFAKTPEQWDNIKDRIERLQAGLNRSKQGVAEGLNEAVGGNYLYHATGADGLKGILSSGSIRSATGPQKATSAQTKLPTVSVTRDWGYASGSQAQSQLSGIGRDAILVLDRNAVESNFKTLSTSQSNIVKGLSFNPFLRKDGEAMSQNTDQMARTNAKAKAKYAEPTAKAGGEFEEAVVVPKGALPLKGTMVGFWINPKSELMKDPAIMNDPRRLDIVRPNQFVKATQQQGVAEGSEQVYKVLAVDKSNALSKKVMLKVKAGSIEEVFERLAMSDWYPFEINGVEVVNGKRLKKGVAESEDQTPGVRTKYRATVEYGPTAADAKFVTVIASTTEEAEQKVAAWCKKNGIRNPMITINGADLPRHSVEEDRHDDYAWRDAAQSGKLVAQQAPAKYFLKDRVTGKVLGQYNSAPDAVRASTKFGGTEKCKVEIMREDGTLEECMINELSNEKLAQYKTAASKDASAADKAGDFKRGDKRFAGIVKATNKQFANDAKQVKESSIMKGLKNVK